jgi:hypothetical protein
MISEDAFEKLVSEVDFRLFDQENLYALPADGEPPADADAGTDEGRE